MRFNPPPNWPAPPKGWTPPADWKPDPAWGDPPHGWPLWVEDSVPQQVVVQAGPSRAVTKSRRKTNHTFHLIASVCTCGLWAVTGWPIAILINRFSKDKETTVYR